MARDHGPSGWDVTKEFGVLGGRDTENGVRAWRLVFAKANMSSSMGFRERRVARGGGTNYLWN